MGNRIWYLEPSGSGMNEPSPSIESAALGAQPQPSTNGGANGREDELSSPQKEAAFFFGLFLRGHSADELRQDIDFPPKLMARWQRRHDPLAPSPEELQRLYDFRKRVLAIFNFLVSTETGRMQ